MAVLRPVAADTAACADLNILYRANLVNKPVVFLYEKACNSRKINLKIALETPNKAVFCVILFYLE